MKKNFFEEDLKPAESSVNLPRLVLAPIEKDKDSVIKQRMVLGDPETAKVGPTGVVIDTEGPMEKEPQDKPLQTEHAKEGENSAEMETNEITVPVARLDAADQKGKIKAVNIASQEVHNIGDASSNDIHNIDDVSSQDIHNIGDVSSQDIHNIRHDDFEPKEEKREWIKSTEYIQEPSIEVERAKDIEIQPLNLEFEKDDVQ